MSKSHSQSLHRKIGLSGAIFFLLGNIVGIGIFLMPGKVAAITANPWYFLGVWVLGGIMALSGAMSSAELGMMMPHAGGDYVFLRRIYGLPWGFLYGYLSFFVSFSGAIAVAATGVVKYQIAGLLGHWIPFNEILFSFDWTGFHLSFLQIDPIHYAFRLEHLFGMALVLLLSLINHYGIRASSVVQTAITIVPIAFFAIAGLIIALLAIFGSGETSRMLSENLALAGTLGGPKETSAWSMLPLALLPVFFTYTGWNAALYLAEDVKRPHRVLPISMIVSLLLVSAMYVLFNLVLLATNPFAELAGDNYNFVVANKNAWGILIGDWAGDFLNIIIVLLILAGMNTTILAGSRMYLAMARDQIFPGEAAKLHPKYNTPYVSLWAQAAMSCLLILIFLDFDRILSLTTLTMIFLSILTISTVFILRRSKSIEFRNIRESNKKIFRVLGYPYMPILYIASSLFVLIGAILGSDVRFGEAMVGGTIILVGFIVYYIFGFIKSRRS